MQKRAKIICTIGPTSNTEEILTKLARSGMDVARLNFSHGTHEEHLANIKLIRKVSKKTGKPIAILMDLQGPKIRIGHFAEGPVTVKPGELFTIVTDDVPGTQYLVGTSYKNLPNDVKPDDNILINDGLIQLKVNKTTKTEVFCEVVIGGILYDRKGINLPGVEVSEPSMTKKDINDLEFGLKHGVDYVALSFVRTAQDIRDLKKMMGEDPVPIIAKIEKPEAVENIDEIIMETEVVMVARGDLGVEISAQKVPVVQKMIIEKCMTAGIPVITATQMLDSMMANPVPTRAEASDVANAIFDGTDAVMLSGETAFGKYPLESASIMASIIREAEKGGYFRLKAERRSPGNSLLSSSRSICHVANISAQDIGAKFIVVFTESGFTAQVLSKYRPEVPVIALTKDDKSFTKMALYWGVIPSQIKGHFEISHGLEVLEEHLKVNNLASAGDKIIIIAGSSSEEGGTNMMRLHRLL
ncbi:MAG: pyruvate kinase [Calditrichaeota bacterium]|nr:MAG: pyruvate kinase [Calditrichota bacterium]MBL1204098.1 pyruvate kinase [Calditrichota bacterium]NOG43929.1 pyruvate kinase [Calditrichota bacterium]